MGCEVRVEPVVCDVCVRLCVCMWCPTLFGAAMLMCFLLCTLFPAAPGFVTLFVLSVGSFLPSVLFRGFVCLGNCGVYGV